MELGKSEIGDIVCRKAGIVVEFGDVKSGRKVSSNGCGVGRSIIAKLGAGIG